MRTHNRANDQMREAVIIPHYLDHLPGSVLIQLGKTKVICAVNMEEKVPLFLRNSDQGWLTAEYAMLPSSTPVRTQREFGVSRQGRSVEIQRLIGRSLRNAIDLRQCKDRTIQIDCDVIQADGGTRTASITGSFVALSLALKEFQIPHSAMIRQIGSISIGIVKGEILLDLDYDEDSQADADFNLVMDEKGEIIELQATGEKKPFSSGELEIVLRYGKKGIFDLMKLQNQAILAITE
jgi:ribonuclease PH